MQPTRGEQNSLSPRSGAARGASQCGGASGHRPAARAPRELVARGVSTM